MTALIQIVSALVGTLAYSVLANLRGKRLVLASLGGMLSWGLFLALDALSLERTLVYALAAMWGTIYAEVLARIVKTPTSMFLYSAVIPLVPGGTLYLTMKHLLSGNTALFVENGLLALSTSAAIAGGMMAVTSITGILNHRAKPLERVEETRILP